MGSRKRSKKSVRRVVSRFEDVICESPALEHLYGERPGSPAQVATLVSPLLLNEPVEVFVALLLAGRQQVAGFVEVSRGTLTTSLVHPREVYGPALRLGCAAVVVVHNHPSGDPEPSGEDFAVTRRLREAGQVLGVPLLDHVILGDEGALVSL